MIHRVRLPKRVRREKILNHLTIAYDTEDKEHLVEAAKVITDHFKMKPVRRFVWRRKFRERVLAKCWASGWIEVLHPAVWKKGEDGPREKWIEAVLHEFGHYVFWVDDEQRADDFAARMMG